MRTGFVGKFGGVVIYVGHAYVRRADGKQKILDVPEI